MRLNVIINLLKNTTKTKVFSNFLNLSIIQVSNILLMVLIYPILTRIIGLENFGKVMVANALAGLLSILVNYGTIQTSIKDVVSLREDRQLLSEIFWKTFSIRLIIFTVVTLVILFSFFLVNKNYFFYLFALPLVLAEVLNPMFFFLGVERLKILNFANLLAKVLTLVLIVLLIKGGNDSVYVNFIMGIILSFTYLFSIVWAIKKYRLKFTIPSWLSQLLILKSNFYLLANNFAVHLQQSLILFALQAAGNALWLGAYALCDKVIWSTRLLIISFSNSLYPKAAHIFKNEHHYWIKFKINVKLAVSALFVLAAGMLLLFPDFIIRLLAGETNELAASYLRQMAFVPLLAALNFINVLDRLLKNDHYTIFRIALIMLMISSFTSFVFVYSGKFQIFGFYAVITELMALLLYEYFIRKTNKPMLNFKD